MAGIPRHMRARPVRLAGSAVGALGLAVALAVPAPAIPAPAPARQPVTGLGGDLFGVSADSPGDAWAVGVGPGVEGGGRSLHWNGTSWERVTIPNASQNDLRGVSAISPRDAWAVGGGRGRRTTGGLILHWNGTTWTRVPSPRPRPGHGTLLLAVGAGSPTNAWAVGFSGPDNNGLKTSDAALHWNGTTWSKVPVPSPSGESSLDGVSVVSPSDAWAVGSYFVGERLLSFIVHWNGTAWARVSSPNPGGSNISLNGVSALSGDDAWAVGYYLASGREKALVLHWDGSSWAQVPVPNVEFVLLGVSALSPSDVWAVGQGTTGTLVLHWNGTSWTRIPSPSPSAATFLNSVSAVSASDAWAAGCRCPDKPRSVVTMVLLHWNGTRWVQA